MNITKEILEKFIKESISFKELYIKLNLQKSKKSRKIIKELCEKYNIEEPTYKRKSIIWAITDTIFKEIINNSFSYKEVLQTMGYQNNKGSINKILKERIKELNISIKHFYTKKIYPIKKENIFTENGTIGRQSVKNRIMNQNLKENICEICKQKPFWNGKPMVLILDHINGIYNDNRLENLRLVCPNCNSQLETTNGKNKKIEKVKERYIKSQNITLYDILIKDKYKLNVTKVNLIKTISILNKPILEKNNKWKNLFCKCGKVKYFAAKECMYCHNKNRRKQERPTIESLKKELLEIGSYVKLGKKYGVSDNCIRKWLNYEKFDIKIEQWKETIYKIKEDILKEDILMGTYKYAKFMNTLKRNIRNNNLNEEQLKILKDLNIILYIKEKTKRNTPEENFKEKKEIYLNFVKENNRRPNTNSIDEKEKSLAYWIGESSKKFKVEVNELRQEILVFFKEKYK
jgi:hypothetical protein